MSNKFENSHNSHNSDQSDEFSGLSDDLHVLHAVQGHGQVEGDDGKEVNEVHGMLEEDPLAGGAHEADGVLEGEEEDGEVIDDPEGVHKVGVHVPPHVLVLELGEGLEDEGECGDDDDAQGGEANDLEESGYMIMIE